ncbi:type VII secretion system-associated protein [Kutzneria sp. 744]|uniref:type VII secretion system-associated protein n=1 Tax=Kutzneria sp. (strain 744) TaxID=345341 RepID=UPI0003EEB6ED|nr:type VII secretion system-associated protein [Kutzneria sp. 744]EWM19108.1 serine/arginine repetitive matrix protein 2 [Kutzneria sp. 744]
MAETATTEETPVALDGDQWVFLIDPAWQAENAEADPAERQRPPLEVVVGGWFVAENGMTGRFQANPAYEPSGPDSPTDPVDAFLQLVVRGDSEADELLDAMRDATFGLAVNAENTPVVVLSPDEVPCVLVATAPAHSRRIAEVEGLSDVAAWAEVELAQVVGVLPEEGVDVLLNPGAPASMRLLAGALREIVAEAGDGEPQPQARPVTESDSSVKAPRTRSPEGQPTRDQSGTAAEN